MEETILKVRSWGTDGEAGQTCLRNGIEQGIGNYANCNESNNFCNIHEDWWDELKTPMNGAFSTALDHLYGDGYGAENNVHIIFAAGQDPSNIGCTDVNACNYDITAELDDGTCWRISENEYFMTTSTAQAGRVMSWLEELLQIRWNKLKVHVTTVSEQWCGVSIGGPKSRECISKCVINKNLIDNENLPFMGVIETKLINEIPCRIARISFSGEMGFEIYVPSDFGNSMMDLLWKEAKDLDGCLYGLEALGALRIEKGHITGAELDGRVTIEDVGLGKMASTKKSYIGSAMKNRGVLNEQNREKLVGFFPVDKSKTFDAGSLICEEDKLKGFGIGRITSVTHSPEFGHWIGLGFIAGGYNSWKDKTVIATDPIRNNNVKVKVVKSHMLDPEGKRMHG